MNIRSGIMAGQHGSQTGGPLCRVLLNHFVGAADERGRKLESEDFGGLQVDEELDFRDELDGQIRGLLAIEDPSGVNASATMRLGEISWKALSRLANSPGDSGQR